MTPSPALATGDSGSFVQTFDTRNVGTGKAVTISGLSHGAQYGFGAFSWPAQAAALVALAAALTPLRRRPGTVFTPERLASPELPASPEFLAIPEHPAGRETTGREEAGPEGEGSR